MKGIHEQSGIYLERHNGLLNVEVGDTLWFHI